MRFPQHSKSDIMTKQILKIPLRVVSEANMSEHWTKKHKRKKEQKRLVTIFAKDAVRLIKPPVTVKLTRVAPRALDQDNLVASFKHVLDVISDLIHPGLAPGRADGLGDISFSWHQEKGKPKEYAILVEFKEVKEPDHT